MFEEPGWRELVTPCVGCTQAHTQPQRSCVILRIWPHFSEPLGCVVGLIQAQSVSFPAGILAGPAKQVWDLSVDGCSF